MSAQAVNSPPRASSSSLTTQASSSTRSLSAVDSKTSGKPSRENQFIYQYGTKLHAYGREKAPYPHSYDRESLEMWCLDRSLFLATRERISFVDFKDNTPKRCLDLATGLGDWVIEAAKAWPECTFVGYDLVNVQIPLEFLDSSISSRIEWVYGNFLRVKLPFEDEEFDYIHINGVAFAVPETKWLSLFEELHRVLRQGGTIEQIEEDAIFPVLPLWFTDPLHLQSRGCPAVQLPDGSLRSACLPQAEPGRSHEHELLEKLFNAVFENRFINPTPSSYLPSPFSTYFTQLKLPPVLSFPMPPLAPLPPLHPASNMIDSPLPEDSFSVASDQSSDYVPRTSLEVSVGSSTFSPDRTFYPPVTRKSIDAETFPPSISDSSIPESNISLSHISSSSFVGSSPRRSSDLPTLFSASASDSDTCASNPVPITSASPSSLNESLRPGSFKLSTSIATLMPVGESTYVGGQAASELLPMDKLRSLEEHSLYMQLQRAGTFVLSLKEAMWDELLEMMKKEDQLLYDYGWIRNDFEEDMGRAKFESMIEQYKSDMHARISLWNSTVLNGWKYPPRDPVTKAELLEEERLRQDILNAREQAKPTDFAIPVRSTRLFIGSKGPHEL